MAGAGDGGGRAAAALEIVEGEEDDAPPSLSARALEALTEFLAEQQRLQEETGVPTRGEDAERDCAVELVSEDWRLSQFWYEPGTARTVAEEIMVLCAAAGSSCLVACVACPTIYAHLKVHPRRPSSTEGNSFPIDLTPPILCGFVSHTLVLSFPPCGSKNFNFLRVSSSIVRLFTFIIADEFQFARSLCRNRSRFVPAIPKIAGDLSSRSSWDLQ